MKKLLCIVPVLLLFFSCASSPSPESGAADAAASKDRAVKAMEDARSIKANVAVKDEFDAAMDAFNQGEAIATGDAAAEKYREAERLFISSYNKAKTQRDAAMDQLNRAKLEIKGAEDDAAALEQAQAESAEGGQ
ncbi:hypothetical protein [Breznakiella homolactica]|uniref:DUF4398 domain-containing protein n=1 Tax=Breznakiella homolactica TaxID=2798577 RepID=A0A7T8BA52_9SPIR|nr:hypothetical protein [Breznakiella homolactica]QQO08630.1 hypothetical protein JFL75_17115 [Breznakiella homolactica]